MQDTLVRFRVTKGRTHTVRLGTVRKKFNEFAGSLRMFSGLKQHTLLKNRAVEGLGHNPGGTSCELTIFVALTQGDKAGLCITGAHKLVGLEMLPPMTNFGDSFSYFPSFSSVSCAARP